MAYAAVPPVSRRVEMWFDGPRQQRRWTVLIRLIAVIPQAIALFFLEIALIVVTVIGWFAALVMGRLPDWVHQFNSAFVSWQARFLGYAYLLTDEYPPFEFGDLPYPIRPIVPSAGKLNRLAVLFRLILAIPAGVFQTIVSYGLIAPLIFVVWVIMVFTGRMPPALYGAYASWVRYQSRFLAYMLMLTSEYPWGMLGDRAPHALSPFPSPPGPPVAAPGGPPSSTPPAPSAPFAQQPVPTATTTAEADPWASTPEPPGEAAIPAPPPAAPAWPPPPPPGFSIPGITAPPPPPPPPWDPASLPPPPSAGSDRSRLVLPGGARKWLVFAIVWGSILLVGQISLQTVAAVQSVNTAIRQYDTVINDFNDSKAAIENAVADSQRCATVPCLRASHLAAATSLDKFDSDLTAMNLSCTATAPAQAVESDLTQLASAFTDLANSPNDRAYRSTVQSSNLNTLLQSLPNDTNTLLNAVRSSSLGSFCSS